MGTDRLTWRDVWVICKAAPAKSRLAVALDPRMAWDVADYLLADQADSLRWLVWSKTPDGEKNRRHPKLIPRPGARTHQHTSEVTAMTVEQMKAYLARKRRDINN